MTALRTAHRPGDAGTSARRQARKLRRAEIRTQHRTAIWWLPPAAVVGYGVLLIAGRMLPADASALALAAGLAVPGLIARRIYAPGEEVRRWRTGADGERRTAALLAPLTWWSGWHILHDRAIPGSKANLDHIAFLPDGRAAVYIDTKAWTSRATVTIRKGGVAYCGNWSLAGTVKTTRWEAEQASRALGIPVTPLIAVHGAKVARGRLALDGGLVIVPAARLRRELHRIPLQRNPQAAAELAARAETALPRHTA